MKLPDFSFEKSLWLKDYKFVCGVDEVGRGCFAGPIYAGAVIFDKSKIRIMNNELRIRDININDSKKLSFKVRVASSKWIQENALVWGVGSASVAEINNLGIVKASQIAFRKAIAVVSSQLAVDFLLIDAFYIPYVKGLRRKNQLAIIRGDSKSISIASASILAKVERDRYMQSLSKQLKYKKYGWDKNKGYGTKEHQLAIKKHGITKHHRKTFVETFLRG